MAFPASVNLSSLDGTSGFRLTGGAANDQSGYSVASAGDINGDGFADLVIGARYADPNGTDSGAAYVVFGKASGFGASIGLSGLNGTTGFKLNGGAAGEFAGWSVASAGDVNGDGYDDVIVGAPNADPNAVSNAGTTYVVFGKASGFASEINLSSLNGSNGFKLAGVSEDDFSGRSVRSAGDVNGDGYDDLIVGAQGADPFGSQSGASYVVFGKASGFAANLNLSTLDGSTGFKLSGVAASDMVGRSVSSAGDINGDGYDDLIIGARGADANGTDSGAAYVVFGRASGFGPTLTLNGGTLDGVTGFRIVGAAAGDWAGFTVGSAGDVNGDGFADLIVGARYADPNGTSSGAAFVVFGKAPGFDADLNLAGLDGTTGFKLNGALANDQLGWSVASAGDMNGDGFADLIVGAAMASPNGSSSGATYVVFGKASGFGATVELSALNGSTGFKLSGVTPSDQSGRSATSAGDVNGDGYDDLIIGAALSDVNGSNSGTSYVVFGGAFGESTAPVTTTGTSAAEFLIGGRGDDALTGGGGADVFHAGAGDDRLVVADMTFELVDGGSDTDTLALGGSGQTLDLTNPAMRVEDIERIDLTGSGNNTLKIDRLAVQGVAGATGDGKHILTVEGNAGDKVQFADTIWEKVGTFSDASGDYVRYVSGNAEVRIEQGVNVVHTLAGLDGTLGFTLNGVTAADQTGYSVSSAGDINGDGFDDLIVGARDADPHGAGSDDGSGAAYVVFGKASGFAGTIELSTLDGTTGFRLSGEANNDRAGVSVSSADFNGDGFDDLIVSAYRLSATYVVFGKASGFAADIDLSTLDGSNGVKLDALGSGIRNASSVASAGDVNGDGIDDIIVGAPFAEARSGVSYVVFGKVSGFTASIDLLSLDGSDGFKVHGPGAVAALSGHRVASAGDVNGDGYDDIFVGAASRSEAYVVFGKASGFAADIGVSSLDGSNGFRLQGANAFGQRLASAGDINGDGYDDLIVGAGSNGTNRHAYVVFGQASFSADLAVSDLDGTNGFRTQDSIGSVVNSAGDFNGDGFDDLIIGSYVAGLNGNASGAVFVVYGKASGFDDVFTGVDGTNGFQLTGAAAFDLAGASVASAGDVNGDGYDDLIVGASTLTGSVSRPGEAYVIFGGAFGATVTTTGTSAAEMLIGGAGDDVLTGGGGADVFHAGAGDDTIVVRDSGFALVDGGNGFDTLKLDDESGAGGGIVLDLSDPAMRARIEGIEQIDVSALGSHTVVVDQAAILGDGFVSGGKHTLRIDAGGWVGGYDDVVQFKGLGWTQLSTLYGGDHAYLRYARGNAIVEVDAYMGVSFAQTLNLADLNGLDGSRFTGAAGDLSGWSVAALGDVNGDGFEDFIVGAAGPDPSRAAYVVFGTGSGFDATVDLASLDGTTGFKLAGEVTGVSVSSAGDVNGDGFADIFVGAAYASPHGVNSGAAYVVFGTGAGFGPTVNLTSLNGSNGFKLSGTAAGDFTGFSVASAGDINGDGFDDLMVGAPHADNGDPLGHSVNAGLTYFVFGKEGGFSGNLDLSTLDGTDGFIMRGAYNSESGFSVSSAGDINGDGFVDLLIGARELWHDHEYVGGVFVMYGKASGFEEDWVTGLDRLYGDDEGDATGFSVAGAGDINGDGYDDIVIGSPYSDANGTDSGSAYVLFGRDGELPSIMTTADLGDLGGVGFRLNGLAAGDHLGISVASAGDFNGDGFDDLLIGASGSGTTYLVLGRANLSGGVDLTGGLAAGVLRIDGLAGDLAGRSVSSAGDVNGDGYDDLLVGAPLGSSGAGDTYIVYGNPLSATVTTTGTGAAEALVGSAGDDVLAGGGGADTFHAGAGDDRIVVGDLDFKAVDGGTGTDTLVLDGGGLTLELQKSEVAAKLESIERIDLTGSGDNTLRVNQTAALGGVGQTVGGQHVLTVEGNAGDKVRFENWQWTFSGSFTDAGGTFDRYVFGDAEVNVEQGVAIQVVANTTVWHLSDIATFGFTIQGDFGGNRAGTSVASAGDVNGDGYDDLIVGAPTATSGGSAYVVYGAAGGFPALFDLTPFFNPSYPAGAGNLQVSTGFKLVGPGTAAAGSAGGSVASAGDVNGDGFADVIVGAYRSDAGGYHSGQAYVVFGKASGIPLNVDLGALNGTDGFKLTGSGYFARAGWSVATAGDVNGDGFDDLIVGAWNVASSPGNLGAAYVVYGKASGFAANIALESMSAIDGFKISQGAGTGWSVATAGDINGDGIDDLFVGAKFDSVNGYQNGAGYIVFGSTAGFPSSFDVTTLNGNNGFKLTGPGAGGLVGVSVATAGDINGDGIDDLVIGGSNAAYVVFGKAGGFGANIELANLDGHNGFKMLGSGEATVASAGDFNGDGFDDLLVVAPGTESTGNGGGSVYVIFGRASGFDATLDLAELPGDAGLRLDGIRAEGDGYGSDDDAPSSAASAGDVNGDGYDDIIIGAPSAYYTSGEGYIVFGSAFDTVVTTVGTQAPEVFIGSDGFDFITGGGGADVFHAGAGDDTIVVRDTTFRMADGGTGIDTLMLSGEGLSLHLEDPLVRAKLEGIERIDLTGSGNNDVRISQAAVLGGIGQTVDGKHILTVTGDDGDTVLFIEPQWTKTGTTANSSGVYDRYEFGDAIVDIQQGIAVPGATVNGTSGNDAISLTSTVAGQPFATNRDDVLSGAAGNDVLNGGNGNDVLIGGRGADTMTGGSGNDLYNVDNAGDVIVEAIGGGIDRVSTTLSSYTLADNVENLEFFGVGAFIGSGNALDNILTGGTGNDTLSAGDGNDRLAGNAGNDTLTGGDGNDALNGGAGDDTMIGGAGNDTYRVEDAGDSVVETIGGGLDTVNTTLSSHTLADNVENLEFVGTGDFIGSGNALGNLLTGGAGNDTLSGDDGNDRLSGNAGNDTLTGGDGNDALNGGAGDDTMIGGAGNDTYRVEDAGDSVVEIAGGGLDTVNTTLSSHTLADEVENLKFVGSGDFTGAGNVLANKLIGGAGNDTLSGDDGNDRLFGGDGNDRLIGGHGADRMTGDADADVFVFREASDSTHAARDTIEGFTVGEDSIDFTEMSTGGTFHALQTVTSVPTTIDAHSLVAYVASSGSTVLYVNDTGMAQTTNHASMEILLKGVTTLSDADLGYILI